MDLILWRHADAEDGAPDLARRLTPKGQAQAERVAAWLRKRLPQDFVLIASPAARAQQTARALQAQFTTEPLLAPGASVEAILRAAGERGTAVIVGHQPELGRALAFRLSGQERDWHVDKGALWWLRDDAVRAVISPDLLQH